MRKIYAIGETLLDIIFRDGRPQTAKPGGSMLNTVVSLGRMSLPVSFISEYAKDDVGDLIGNFLIENGVDISFVHCYTEGQTALALAFLDEKNDARYTFYKSYPKNRLNISFPEINREDIVLCGSFYALSSEIRDKYLSFIKQANKAGAIVLYDPNFRKSHLSEIESLRPVIIENMKLASIVRGSDEDFRNIFGTKDPHETRETVRKYCSNIVYTANADGVYVFTSSFSGKFPVRKIEPLSTIGAGDNFNAGMIFALFNAGIERKALEVIGENEWEKVISTAVAFATDVCMSYENYISTEFAREFRINPDRI
jgi:fructokinase